MCLDVIGGEISSEKEMAFLFRSRDSSFLQNNVYHHHQTIYLSVFGPQKEFSKQVATGFTLFAAIETSRFIGWKVNTLFVSKCWTIHISNIVLYIFIWLFQLGH